MNEVFSLVQTWPTGPPKSDHLSALGHCLFFFFPYIFFFIIYFSSLAHSFLEICYDRLKIIMSSLNQYNSSSQLVSQLLLILLLILGPAAHIFNIRVEHPCQAPRSLTHSHRTYHHFLNHLISFFLFIYFLFCLYRNFAYVPHGFFSSRLFNLFPTSLREKKNRNET